jgi:hypothetical protein
MVRPGGAYRSHGGDRFMSNTFTQTLPNASTNGHAGARVTLHFDGGPMDLVALLKRNHAVRGPAAVLIAKHLHWYCTPSQLDQVVQKAVGG